MKSSDVERLRPLATPAYALAVLLIVIPLLDTLFAMLPTRLGDVSWRFGALGLGSQALMTPLLGALVALATAVLLEHRRGVRVLQVLAWVVAAGLVGAIVLFLLDAVQVRASVKAEAKPALDKVSVLALGKYFAGVAVSMMFAVSSHRLAKRMRADTGSDSDKGKLVFEGPGGKS